MVEIRIEDDTLVVDVLGVHQVFAMKGKLTVPLSHVRSARHDPSYATRFWHGFKMIGADIPGIFAAGTFWSSEGWRFWDVLHPEQAIVIELIDERLAEIIVDVAEPDAAVKLINDAVRRAR
jgi:hypothetical protein